ncbi:MAG TPA: class I SAM-dependent methyltransferase [Tepidisphaeraceae bacterium]|jgi:hypothetical protein|nr:class I SAM-dependent methyltransferase [Tepidisphaeraceae bacterium]
MQLDPRDRKFISQTLPSIEGWLKDASAYLTCALMRHQSTLGITGSILEIGVFAGKYLSLLYHLSADTRDSIVGLDTFEFYPRPKVEKNFSAAFREKDRLILVTSDSTLATPQDLLISLRTNPRFISVDGAHTAQAVQSDLALSEKLLAPGGIVAIDDFLNPRAIGVGEGAYRYFISRGSAGLVPFAFCANKLYAARKADGDEFKRALWNFAAQNSDLAMSREFSRLAAQGKHWVEQELLESTVLIF